MGSTHDSLTASNSRGGSTGHANIHRIKPRIKLQLQCSIARQISSHCRLPLCHEQSQGCHCSFNSSRATARVSAAPRPASRTAPDATVTSPPSCRLRSSRKTLSWSKSKEYASSNRVLPFLVSQQSICLILSVIIVFLTEPHSLIIISLTSSTLQPHSLANHRNSCYCAPRKPRSLIISRYSLTNHHNASFTH